jgi:hypothetical protein
MRYAKGSFKEFRPDILAKFAVTVLLLAGVGAVSSMGQQKDQKTFSSAEEAAKALCNAAKATDEKALVEILGLKGRHLISFRATPPRTRKTAPLLRNATQR